MLGTQPDGLSTVVRLKPPLRLRRWSVKRRDLFRVGLTGFLPNWPTQEMDIPPIVFAEGRYVVTEGGDDFVLEDRDERAKPRPTFDPHNPLEGWRAALTASNYVPWGPARKAVAQMLRHLSPPVGITDFDAFGRGDFLTVTGIISTGKDRRGERHTFDLNFLNGRYAKSVEGKEFILYEPSVDFRRRHCGFDPLHPLAPLGF